MRHTLVTIIVGLACFSAVSSRAGDPKIVENPDHGLWDDVPRKNFQILEDLVLGSEDGDDAFGRIADFAIDSRGRWIVLDGGFCQVKAYDPNEMTMKTIGGKGEGPGEFDRPTALGLDVKDDIYVASQGGRIAVFASAGEFIEEFRHKFQGGGSVTGVEITPSGVYLACFDPVLKKMVHRYDRDYAYLSSFSDSWSVVKAMDVSEEFASCWGAIDVDAAGNVLYTQGMPYEIRKFSPAGELLLTIRRNNGFMVPPKIERTENGMSVRSYGGSTRVLALPDGKIMNVALQIRGEDPVYYATFVDLFDADGRLLKSRRIEGRVLFKCLDARGRLYASKEKDYPQVVRYRLEMP